MSTGSAVVGFGALLVVGYLLVVGWPQGKAPQATNSSPPRSSAAPTEPPVVVASPPPLHLLSSRGYESEYGGYHHVEGQVKNVSAASLENVTVVVTWYDKNGNFIKADDALIAYNPILPGQVSPFETMTTGNPAMSKYTVEFKYLLGGKIECVDMRKK